MWQYLVLDLLGGVSEEDGGVGITGAHLGLGPLQGGEEGGMQQGRFRIADPGGHVAGHPEVRVLVARKSQVMLVLSVPGVFLEHCCAQGSSHGSNLVNGTRDETLYVLPSFEDLWERVAEGWGSLDSWEADFAFKKKKYSGLH